MFALLRISGIRHRDQRDLFIRLLEEELRHPLPIPRDEHDLFDVWHLVEGCLAYPGAIRQLVELIEQLQGDSVAVLEVRQLVDDLVPEPLLPSSERRTLYRLARELDNGALSADDRARISDFFRSAVGPIGPVPDRQVGDVRDVLAQLEDLTVGPDGIPPLLTFVEDLAACAGEPVATHLRMWAEDFAARLGLDPDAGPRARQRAVGAVRSARKHSYLAIELRPAPMAGDRFFVSAWLQFDIDPSAMLWCDDEDPVRLGDLPALINGLLTDHRVVHRPATDDAELVIELIVPRRLLCAPFDQFPITIEGLERRLGIDHPVVVRSLERLQGRVLHHKWRRKWARLRNDPTQITMHPISRRGVSSENLYTTLVLNDSLACVVMPFPPQVDEGPADELWTAVQAGVPVAAWCRRPRDCDRFVAEFRELLDQGVLALPESVLALRRKALLAQDDHVGLALTLMFDNADRLPEPYVRLSAPA